MPKKKQKNTAQVMKNSCSSKEDDVQKPAMGKEKYTLFYSIKSPFSQFHPTKFTVGDMVYSCAEQYMMHQKAGCYKQISFYIIAEHSIDLSYCVFFLYKKQIQLQVHTSF